MLGIEDRERRREREKEGCVARCETEERVCVCKKEERGKRRRGSPPAILGANTGELVTAVSVLISHSTASRVSKNRLQ